jgi:uncharacterized protein YbjT (DUF2867 family)
MRIVVIGDSELMGSKLVAELGARGHEAVAASPGVDTLTCRGLAAALEGASVVVDVAAAPSFENRAALEFFDSSTRNLLAAGAAAGVRQHILLSVVGAERLSAGGYFRARITQEALVETSSIPYSIVRATQLFECIMRIGAAATDGDTVRLPPALVRPIAADDVAAALGRICEGEPLNGIGEIAGPDVFRLDELIRARLGAGDPRRVVTDPGASYFGVTPGERALLPGADAQIARTRLRDWLHEASRRAARPGPG